MVKSEANKSKENTALVGRLQRAGIRLRGSAKAHATGPDPSQVQSKVKVKQSRRPSFFRSISRHSNSKDASSLRVVEVARCHDLIDLEWQANWLSSRRALLPPIVAALEVQGEPISSDGAFDTVYRSVALHLRQNRGLSIDDIIEHLEEKGLLSSEKDGNSLDARRLLVFAILGWQSMVYQPAFNVCFPSELAVHNNADGIDSGLVFDFYRASVDMCDRPLHVLLKYLGNLLPARSRKTATVAAETSKEAVSWTALYPAELNAYLLHTLLSVQFRWVDSLALHLDYDKSTRTLSLFSFPSICASQLRDHNSTIFAFASTEVDAPDPRADEDDIDHFLGEVLLSFRLLFGQSVKSRKPFRMVFTPTDAPFPEPDALLPILCTEKQVTGQVEDTWLPTDRPVYYAARHFPVLYERINILSQELNNAKPKSIQDLLHDRRDTLQFWTFWLVALVGGISILLSILQIVLQGVQIAMSG